jgi:hypothetical protein
MMSYAMDWIVPAAVVLAVGGTMNAISFLTGFI